MNAPVLEMKDVVKYYGDNAVLDGVSFRVYKGETKIIIPERLPPSDPALY